MMEAARLLYDRKEAARQLSISIRGLDYIIAAKELDIRRIGRKVLVTHASLVRYASGNHYMVKRPNLNQVKRNVRRTALQTA
jgi:hypothetical protein